MKKQNIEYLYVIGAGDFAKKYIPLLLDAYSLTNIVVIDKNIAALQSLKHLPLTSLHMEGVSFLLKAEDEMGGCPWIVPLVPFHLAFYWLVEKLSSSFGIIKNLSFTRQMTELFPHPHLGAKGELYCSYANFVCPDNCSDSEDICAYTKQKRQGVLFETLRNIHIKDFDMLVVPSVQIIPGIGAYSLKDLCGLYQKVLSKGVNQKYIVATACHCHGILDSFLVL